MPPTATPASRAALVDEPSEIASESLTGLVAAVDAEVVKPIAPSGEIYGIPTFQHAPVAGRAAYGLYSLGVL